MKVLLCSPFSDAPNTIRGGINTWGRYIITYYEQYGRNQVELIPVSLDRTVFTEASTSILKRILYGIRDQSKQVKQALRLMKLKKPNVVHICTSAGLGGIRDFILVHVNLTYFCIINYQV